jgi:hypothetical protein
VSASEFLVISPHAGFALMKLSALLNASYERSPLITERFPETPKALRSTFPKIDPARYRGIDRSPLCEHPIPDHGSSATPEHRALDDCDVAARVRMLDFVGRSNEDYFGSIRCVVPTVENARELESLLETPSQYEIVRLSQSSPGEGCVEDKDLGFDIGYWGSDSYSIICDSAIWPRWHGPYDDVLPELATRLAELNPNCLFQTHEAADRFRSWYRSQDWAEQEGEPGEFCIIKVQAVCTK